MKVSLRQAAIGVLALLPVSVTARAILGVDLGSLYMKVALVKSGSPLEIVTNLHSKRKTEQMILFDRQQRFYGADASALLARKSQQTPVAMSVMLGRDEKHPIVEVLAERHFPIKPSYNETRTGITLTVDGAEFTPEELVAMVLTHAVDISVAHAASHGSDIPPPKDCVLTVPSFATQRERQALMDAAVLADLNVLTLIDENTAAAVQYAMDKQFEEEKLMMFYNMGGSSVQVSLVRFFNYEQPQKYGKPKTVPSLEVLGKAWDATVGGQAFDHLLVEHLADQFNEAWVKSGRGEGKDVRNYPRAMTKLRLQANKVKHVLSANTEFPVYMEAVYDDVSLSTHVKREQLEEMAAELIERAIKPVHEVLKVANKTMADLTAIELIGGGMRIPKVQTELSKAIGEMELGMHINADEAMALGAAFAGANISTAFRVRSVGMTDVNPFAMSVSLSDLPMPEEKGGFFGGGKKKEKDEEEWNKKATIFKANGKVGIKKTIAFTHDRDVHCELDYIEDELLPKGTELSIQAYNISGVAEFAKEMAEKELGKPKVSLQFELSSSGVASLIKAEAAVEETYTVEEEVEVDDDEAEANATEGNATAEAEKQDKSTDEEAQQDRKTEEADVDENATETNSNETDVNGTDAKASNETKKPAKKPKKKIKVEKEKKKIHKKQLSVNSYQVGRIQPHTAELLAESKQKLLDMAVKDKERMMLEESRNKVESYIYRIKNKLEDDAEAIGAVSTEEQREEVRKLAVDAEDWMYEDGYSADLATMEDKYAELSVPFEKIMLRVSEKAARPEAITALQKKLTDIEQLLVKWETSKPQITEEERAKATEQIEDVRKWIADQEEAQAKVEPHEDPAFLSTDVPKQTKTLEKYLVGLSKKPKPKPPKNETKSDNTTTVNVTGAADENATSDGSNETSGEGADTAEAPANETEEADEDDPEQADASGEEAKEASESVEDEL